jgi:hypothetical protein
MQVIGKRKDPRKRLRGPALECFFKERYFQGLTSMELDA